MEVSSGSGKKWNFCSSAADPASVFLGTFARLARDPRGYGGRDRAVSIDLAISQTMVPRMGRVPFYYFSYGPASLLFPF
jgi:hypothetical protein